MKQIFMLVHPEARARAMHAVKNAPEGHCVYCGANFQRQYPAQEYCGLRCFHAQRSRMSESEDHMRQKLMRDVSVSPGCWEFAGLRAKNGYGRLLCRGKMCLAHRVSFEVHKGEIPEGLNVLHKCDNRPCVNPDHLFLGTAADNNWDKSRKGRAPRGESHVKSKYTEQQVRAIFADTRPYREIVAEYGISKPQISAIKSGKYWAHLNLVQP